MAILASLGPYIYGKLHTKAEDIILSEQRRYQQVLIKAASGMSGERNLEKLLKLIAYLINSTVKLEFTAIFLKDNGGYRLRAIRDHGNVPADVVLPDYSPVILLAKAQKEHTMIYEKAGELMRGYLEKPVGLVVPAFMDKELIGIMALGEKRNKAIFSQNDINVFRILADEASLAIMNCIYMQKYSEEKDKRFAEQKRAVMVGLMSGVVHRINNMLTVISMAAQNVDEDIKDLLKEIPRQIRAGKFKELENEFFKHFNIIKDTAKKTYSMLGKAANLVNAANKLAVSVNMVFSDALKTAERVVKTGNNTDDIFLAEEENLWGGTIYGVKERLIDILENLLDNSYKAICDKITMLDNLGGEEKDNYKPRIRVGLQTTNDKHIISVTDNGIGMSDAAKGAVFAPFRGAHSPQLRSGMGLYVVKSMVEDIFGGTIEFESEYMKGTTFRIKLPKEAKFNV